MALHGPAAGETDVCGDASCDRDLSDAGLQEEIAVYAEEHSVKGAAKKYNLGRDVVRVFLEKHRKGLYKARPWYLKWISCAHRNINGALQYISFSGVEEDDKALRDLQAIERQRERDLQARDKKTKEYKDPTHATPSPSPPSSPAPPTATPGQPRTETAKPGVVSGKDGAKKKTRSKATGATKDATQPDDVCTGRTKPAVSDVSTAPSVPAKVGSPSLSSHPLVLPMPEAGSGSDMNVLGVRRLAKDSSASTKDTLDSDATDSGNASSGRLPPSDSSTGDFTPSPSDALKGDHTADDTSGGASPTNTDTLGGCSATSHTGTSVTGLCGMSHSSNGASVLSSVDMNAFPTERSILGGRGGAGESDGSCDVVVGADSGVVGVDGGVEGEREADAGVGVVEAPDRTPVTVVPVREDKKDDVAPPTKSDHSKDGKSVAVSSASVSVASAPHPAPGSTGGGSRPPLSATEKSLLKVQRKLREIETLMQRRVSGVSMESTQLQKISKRPQLLVEEATLLNDLPWDSLFCRNVPNVPSPPTRPITHPHPPPQQQQDTDTPEASPASFRQHLAQAHTEKKHDHTERQQQPAKAKVAEQTEAATLAEEKVDGAKDDGRAEDDAPQEQAGCDAGGNLSKAGEGGGEVEVGAASSSDGAAGPCWTSGEYGQDDDGAHTDTLGQTKDKKEDKANDTDGAAGGGGGVGVGVEDDSVWPSLSAAAIPQAPKTERGVSVSETGEEKEAAGSAIAAGTGGSGGGGGKGGKGRKTTRMRPLTRFNGSPHPRALVDSGSVVGEGEGAGGDQQKRRTRNASNATPRQEYRPAVVAESKGTTPAHAQHSESALGTHTHTHTKKPSGRREEYRPVVRRASAGATTAGGGADGGSSGVVDTKDKERVTVASSTTEEGPVGASGKAERVDTITKEIQTLQGLLSECGRSQYKVEKKLKEINALEDSLAAGKHLEANQKSKIDSKEELTQKIQETTAEFKAIESKLATLKSTKASLQRDLEILSTRPRRPPPQPFSASFAEARLSPNATKITPARHTHPTPGTGTGTGSGKPPPPTVPPSPHKRTVGRGLIPFHVPDAPQRPMQAGGRGGMTARSGVRPVSAPPARGASNETPPLLKREVEGEMETGAEGEREVVGEKKDKPQAAVTDDADAEAKSQMNDMIPEMQSAQTDPSRSPPDVSPPIYSNYPNYPMSPHGGPFSPLVGPHPFLPHPHGYHPMPHIYPTPGPGYGYGYGYGPHQQYGRGPLRRGRGRYYGGRGLRGSGHWHEYGMGMAMGGMGMMGPHEYAVQVGVDEGLMASPPPVRPPVPFSVDVAAAADGGKEEEESVKGENDDTDKEVEKKDGDGDGAADADAAAAAAAADSTKTDKDKDTAEGDAPDNDNSPDDADAAQEPIPALPPFAGGGMPPQMDYRHHVPNLPPPTTSVSSSVAYYYYEPLQHAWIEVRLPRL
ncbi:unnamed protein product [Vitrella brassicaformis CCMP3155]|uniref:Uncharacterized protein n=1 Tax=Vitrella brassicaformis (strain CCMP3155) TaxID=1169540 RepID=A0A0G4H8E2_VITBC|nr:unnamed protein product [Vitrella brassicaformis CCMP3155]|eukprot:CEM40135.1 unnamed protein product [Vitrella brassicaformis CCMP3155]